METTPAIVTYAPLIGAAVIGFGILITLIIYASRIIFRLGGLFTEVANVAGGVKELRADVKELRADIAKGNEELRHEIHNSTERIVDTLAHHRHTDTDGGVIFTRPVN